MAKRARGKGRMKRAYLNKYAAHLIHGKLGIDKLVMQDLNYHGRAEAQDDAYADKLVQLIWGRTPPKTPNEPRKFVLDKLVPMLRGIDVFNMIRLEQTDEHQVFMFFRNKSVFLVERRLKKEEWRKSINYVSRDQAIRSFRLGRTVWVEYSSSKPIG